MKRAKLIVAMLLSAGGHAAVLLPGGARSDPRAMFRLGDSAVTVQIVSSAERSAPLPGEEPVTAEPVEALPPAARPDPEPQAAPAAPAQPPRPETSQVRLARAWQAEALGEVRRQIAAEALQAADALQEAADRLARVEFPQPAAPRPAGAQAPSAPASRDVTLPAPACGAAEAPPSPPAPAAAAATACIAPEPAPPERGLNSRASDGAAGDEGVCANPRAEGTIHPRYPLLSRRRGEQGRVVLHWRVLPSGRAEDVRVVASSGHACLDEAAAEAVRGATFIPARQQNRPVAAAMTQAFRFRLTEAEY